MLTYADYIVKTVARLYTLGVCGHSLCTGDALCIFLYTFPVLYLHQINSVVR
jgi:hypothetical protein